jgi:hypothetical protein
MTIPDRRHSCMSLASTLTVLPASVVHDVLFTLPCCLFLYESYMDSSLAVLWRTNQRPSSVSKTSSVSVEGDPTRTSVSEEFAGAGSILHHLVAFDLSRDPLFSRTILKVLHFLLLYGRKGILEETINLLQNRRRLSAVMSVAISRRAWKSKISAHGSSR